MNTIDLSEEKFIRWECNQSISSTPVYSDPVKIDEFDFRFSIARINDDLVRVSASVENTKPMIMVMMANVRK